VGRQKVPLNSTMGVAEGLWSAGPRQRLARRGHSICRRAEPTPQIRQFSRLEPMTNQTAVAGQIGGSRARSDQDRQQSVTDADLRRGARSPNPGAVRLADHMGGCGQRRQALQSIRPDGVTLEGAGSAGSPRSRRFIDGQVNRDASPHTERPGSSLRRRPQLAASCWRGVRRVGARAGPARTAAGAVPAVLAEQDRPGPRGVRWL
jgi:hypothetical protein